MRLILTAALVLAPLMAQSSKPAKRLDQATAVLSEIMDAPDKGIPSDLLGKAHCIVVIPGMKKVAFVVGGEYGSGYISCRSKTGVGWSAPGSVKIAGGSVGFQLGGSDTDLVMLIMNQGGADKLLSDKFTLGADTSVAAGPVGRSAAAQTDVEMHAAILSWSRTQGVFAGISLAGATFEQVLSENEALYHKRLTNKEIVNSGVRVPKVALGLIGLLNKDSDREVVVTSAGSN
jgi:lipid-binding SYLF domain-containing protein